MAKGRPAKPTPLKVLAGSRADRMNVDEPRAAPGRPDPPAYLADDPEAAAEWDRIVPELEAMGVLTRADGPALAIYCSAHSRAVKARRSLNEDGFYLISGMVTDPQTGQTVKSGVVKGNPAGRALLEAEAVMLKVLASFGCDPSSRSRVKAKAQGPADPLADFLNRRKAKAK